MLLGSGKALPSTLSRVAKRCPSMWVFVLKTMAVVFVSKMVAGKSLVDHVNLPDETPFCVKVICNTILYIIYYIV